MKVVVNRLMKSFFETHDLLFSTNVSHTVKAQLIITVFSRILGTTAISVIVPLATFFGRWVYGVCKFFGSLGL